MGEVASQRIGNEFGRRRLEYKRIFPPKKLEGWRDRIERYLWRPT
jgi:hypothetical protein